MNILQLVPRLNVGGVEKGTVEVARALVAKGHKAVVVSGGGIYEGNLAAIGARHYTVPVGKKNPITMIWSYICLRRIIRKESIDIVHARSRIPALMGYFAAKSTGKVFLTTAHGQYKPHLISRVMGWGKIVIVANDTMARYMKDKFGVPTRKLSIIPRGVDLERFGYVSPFDKDRKKFRVGMICRYTPLKGHQDFLKAMSYVSRRMNNLEIVIMGDRASAKEDYLKRVDLTVRRLRLENVIRFIDSSHDVAEVLKDLDVFVSANRSQEAFGRSIIEAQARGVPVVATRVGGVVENVEDGVTGLLCEPMNPSDIAEKVMRYAQDRELVERVSRAARKNVEDHFSLGKVMESTLEVYSKALSMKNILIMKISSLGDIILAVPSMRAVRKAFPGAEIKVLADIRFREVLSGCPYIDDVITCDFRTRDKGVGFLRLAGAIRSEDLDMSIDLQNSRKSHMLAYLAAIPERYGFNNGKLSVLLNRKAKMPARPMPPVRQQGCVLALLGIAHVDDNLELWPTPENEEWAEKFFGGNWLQKDQKIVAMSVSASRKWRSKNVGVPTLVKVADMLAKERGVRTVLIGAEEDKLEASEFMKTTLAKPIDAVGKTNIGQFIALIKRCDIVVTGDSAPMHVASAVNTPFVSYFGPTDPARHLPPSGKKKVLHRKVKCSPCYDPICRRDRRCMTSIKPADIYNAVMELL
ncbi:MAG: lipopolysaccharide heptosyltransferase II [Candidatus Omnitrophica bacterium]|nr:lipopolysaccharide heptosyltransferase II [Candidatus Omnitrophota bacterium]MDD5487619.1 lipopolysaccharide heptosyltransferase II [Candidatus Omnitrophota bacterium]